ncbi:hypothetical protein D3C85_810780 [compost metagenome]
MHERFHQLRGRRSPENHGRGQRHRRQCHQERQGATIQHEQGVHQAAGRQGDPEVDTAHGGQRANDGDGPQPAIEQDVLADTVHGAHDQGDHGRLHAKERRAQRGTHDVDLKVQPG